MCGTGYRLLPDFLSLLKLHCFWGQEDRRLHGYRLRRVVPGQLHFWLPQSCVPNTHGTPAKLADSLENCPWPRALA
eukprot:2672765-Amphidinium_carterae.1